MNMLFFNLVKEKENSFKDNVWVSIYKRNESNFKEVLRGSINSKDAFKSKLLSEFIDNTSSINPVEDLISRTKTIFNETPVVISLFNDINFNRLKEIEEDFSDFEY